MTRAVVALAGARAVGRWLALLGCLLVAAACSETSPDLNEPCTLICRGGLLCSSRGYCEKSCRCDGGALCASSALGAGCQATAICVVTGSRGSGRCVNRCADRACAAGEGACAVAPDGTAICVGEGFPWAGLDAGDAATDR